MLSSLDPLTVGWAVAGSVVTYLFAESKIRAGEVDLSFGEREGFPVPFAILKEDDSDEEIGVGATIALPLRHIVVVNSVFCALSKPIQRFILLHECGHMRNWDTHATVVMRLVCAVAASILFPVHPLSAAIGISLIVQPILSAIQERRADSFAISHASVEVLKGGISGFEKKHAMRLQQWDEALSIGDKLALYLSEFAYYVLKGHPLESSRIAAVQKELQLRENISLDLPILCVSST